MNKLNIKIGGKHMAGGYSRGDKQHDDSLSRDVANKGVALAKSNARLWTGPEDELKFSRHSGGGAYLENVVDAAVAEHGLAETRRQLKDHTTSIGAATNDFLSRNTGAGKSTRAQIEREISSYLDMNADTEKATKDFKAAAEKAWNGHSQISPTAAAAKAKEIVDAIDAKKGRNFDPVDVVGAAFPGNGPLAKGVKAGLEKQKLTADSSSAPAIPAGSYIDTHGFAGGGGKGPQGRSSISRKP